MLKLVFVNIFLLGFLLCNAQQRIIFEKKIEKSNSENVVFYLPHAVFCTFKNKNKYTLNLIKIQNDSFYFENIKHSEIKYSCVISDLQKIKFIKRGEFLLYALTGTLLISTISLSCLTTIVAIKGQEGAYESLPIPIILSLILGTSTYLLSKTLFKTNFEMNQWRVYFN